AHLVAVLFHVRGPVVQRDERGVVLRLVQRQSQRRVPIAAAHGRTPSQHDPGGNGNGDPEPTAPVPHSAVLLSVARPRRASMCGGGVRRRNLEPRCLNRLSYPLRTNWAFSPVPPVPCPALPPFECRTGQTGAVMRAPDPGCAYDGRGKATRAVLPPPGR